jgi:hypothetical protein
MYRDGLLDDYSIVASNGIRYFLRNDLYQRLIALHEGTVEPVDQAPACLAWYPKDNAFSRERRTCLVLNHAGEQHNFK